MKYYRFPEWKWGKAVMGLFLLALLLFGRESMICTTVIPFLTCQKVTLALLFGLGVTFLAVNHRQLKGIFTDLRLAAATVFVLIFLLPMVLKQDWRLMYISILLGLLVAVLFTYFSTSQEIGKIFQAEAATIRMWMTKARRYLKGIPELQEYLYPEAV